MTTEQINTVFSILRNAEKQIKSETGLELNITIRDLKGEIIGLRAKVEFLAKMLGYSLNDLQSSLRHFPMVYARTIITGIIKLHLGDKYIQAELGRLFDKDHATISNYEKNFDNQYSGSIGHLQLFKSFNTYLKINA